MLDSLSAVLIGAAALVLGAVPSHAAHSVTIAPGVEMPVVNMGGLVNSTEAGPGNYTLFLELGGRGLDTAIDYGTLTETTLGQAVAASGLKREEIFITSKIICCPARYFPDIPECHPDKGYANLTAEEQVVQILHEIDVDYVDLLLLHAPCLNESRTLNFYGVLEKALAENKTRAIGVSNFKIYDYETLERGGATVKPAVNQAQLSIGAHDFDTIKYSREHNITYEG